MPCSPPPKSPRPHVAWFFDNIRSTVAEVSFILPRDDPFREEVRRLALRWMNELGELSARMREAPLPPSSQPNQIEQIVQ